MTRVLFVSHSSELNGAERMLLDTLRGLDRKAFAPFLVAPRPGPLGEAAARAGIEFRVLPMKWTLTEKAKVWRQLVSWAWDARSARAAERLVRGRDVRLVVTNSAAVWTGALAARRAGVPHVWLVHEILDGPNPLLRHIRGRRALARRMERLSARIIANSEASARPFRASGKAVVIGNGIALRDGPPPDVSSLRASLGIGSPGPVLGVVGKLYPGKGQLEAVLAAGILRKAHPGLRLLVIGAVEDARYEDRVRMAAGDSGLAEKVLFLGYRDDLADLLALMDVLLVPSSVDSLGRTALEAMAAGTPVVAAPAGGLPEVVRDGETGVLVPAAEPEALAAGVARVLADPSLAARLRAGGRRFVADRYPLEGQVRRIERILEECLEG